MCRPVIHDKTEGVCQIYGFYNPVTALADPDTKQIKTIFLLTLTVRFIYAQAPTAVENLYSQEPSE